MTISPAVLKRLYSKSGNRCAFPGCKECLIFDEVNQSNMCHIISPASNGPRHIENFNGGNYDEEDNIIVLCLMHHNLVDNRVNEYPADTLRDMKRCHEQYIEEALRKNDSNLVFIRKFLNICAECNMNEMLSQNLVSPFKDLYFDMSTVFHEEINHLLHSIDSINVDKNILHDIEYFASNLDLIYLDAAIYCPPSLDGYAYPRFQNWNDKIQCRDNLKEIQTDLFEIYNKYRYWVPSSSSG